MSIESLIMSASAFDPIPKRVKSFATFVSRGREREHLTLEPPTRSGPPMRGNHPGFEGNSSLSNNTPSELKSSGSSQSFSEEMSPGQFPVV